MSGFSPAYNPSLSIKQEIQRFESVHPSIYAIYDLIEAIDDKELQDSIRDHVVCIEDSFVNSQEWTLNRAVPELKLGVVGSAQSGKSALVHRYLTGSYMQDDSPEGGRFKKEVAVPDVGSCLLLIRDEGGPPDQQFAAWCDACLFVFALDSSESLEAVYQFYGRMAQCRNLGDLPLMLVGTQDSISESRPRAIDESRTRRAVQDLRRCPYYETCATYGHNVDRVFQEACNRMVASRYHSAVVSGGRPSPLHHQQHQQQQQQRAPLGAYNAPPPHSASSRGEQHQQQPLYYEPAAPASLPAPTQQPLASPPALHQQKPGSGKKASDSMLWSGDAPTSCYYASASVPATQQATASQQPAPLGHRSSRDRASYAHGVVAFAEQQPLQQQPPSGGATPTQGRKSRRRSNLFTRKEESAAQQLQQPPASSSSTASVAPSTAPGATVGSGRAIPMKQGLLYKRSTGVALSRTEWKKKYAAIGEDGQLTYYASLHDYMADSHGKSIDLSRSTVKVPGQPRPTSNGLLMKQQSQQPQPHHHQPQNPHRRAKSSGRGGGGDSTAAAAAAAARTPDEEASATAAAATGGFEFTIVSLDGRTRNFEAPSREERDAWVSAIELGILRRLQRLSPASTTSTASAATSAAAASARNGGVTATALQLRDVLGNGHCADCGQPEPDWASLNLGVLVCIECSGAHRQLGTHLSRVRSLTLDEWPAHHLLVMRAIGNRLANSVWEARLPQTPAGGQQPQPLKPGPDAPRDWKEQFVRAKYERMEYLPELPYPDCPVQQQLVDAIARSDTRQVILCLAVAGQSVNRPYSQQDPRAAVHIAATLGQLAYLQLLLWYGADPAVRDAEGRTGHFYAAAAGKPECAEFLLASGCPPPPSAAAAATSAGAARRRRSYGSPTEVLPTAANEIGL